MQITTSKKIDFIDLKAQKDRIGSDIRRRMDGVFQHGRYIMGPEIQELEKELCDFSGAKYCISCASGTDALLMALMVRDVGPGDIILTTPFTFISTAEVITLLGATPVFVDIDAATFNLDPDQLRKKIISLLARPDTQSVRGVIPVDLFGQPADYDAINDIAREFDLFVLEDAAQSFGAEYRGKRAGNLADIAATSFFPAKPLGCYGDGGAVLTNDALAADKLQSIRVHGKGNHKYDNVRIGINGRLDTLQAAILLPKLEIYQDEIVRRNRVARRYSEGLAGHLKTPAVAADKTSVWAQYSVLSENRDRLMDQLKQKGVPSAIYYPKPLHLQSAFTSLGYKKGDFPVSEKIAGTIFSLPMHPYLKTEDQDFIIESVIESVAQ